HERRLARARRPHHRDELAGVDGDRDAAEGMHLPGSEGVVLDHVPGLDEGLGHHRSGGPPGVVGFGAPVPLSPTMTSCLSFSGPSSTSVLVPSVMPSRMATASALPSGVAIQTRPGMPTPVARGVPDGPRPPGWADPPPPGRCGRSASTPGGRKRSAAFGTRSTSGRCSVTMRTFAVMPGNSLRSVFCADTTTSYVTTFCTTCGAFLICTISPPKN